MILNPVKNDVENLYFSIQSSETGLINIGIYQVMFGFRVRGWIKGKGGCNVDWCAGSTNVAVEILYSMLKSILELRPENEQAFDGIPELSKVKPFYNDKEFVAAVAELLPDHYEVYRLPNLYTDAAKINEEYARTHPSL